MSPLKERLVWWKAIRSFPKPLRIEAAKHQPLPDRKAADVARSQRGRGQGNLRSRLPEPSQCAPSIRSAEAMPAWQTPRPPSQNPAPPTLLIVAPAPSTTRLLIPAAQAFAMLTLDHTGRAKPAFCPIRNGENDLSCSLVCTRPFVECHKLWRVVGPVGDIFRCDREPGRLQRSDPMLRAAHS